MSNTYTMLNDNLLIKQNAEGEKVSKGGIVIAGAGIEQFATTGTVIAVGPGKFQGETLVPVTAKVGDLVHFNTKAAIPFEPEVGNRYFIVRETDLYCIAG